MKKKIKRFGAVAAALLLALALLDVFCLWYYNPPRYLWEESRATDTIRDPGAFTSRLTEGFAFSRMDANGYNNASLPGEDGVFVLMMGSSHTEGLNVMQEETVSSLLGNLLADAGKTGSVYNIGMSAHTFPKNVANLSRALERFAPTGYVVLETQDVILHKMAIEAAMNDGFERQAASPEILSEWISDRPLLKTLYNQFSSLISGGEDDGETAEVVITQDQLDQYQAALVELFAYVRQQAEDFGVTPIIYYHPHLVLQEDGSAQLGEDYGCRAAFAAACSEAGVCFVDMTETFLQNYADNHQLPHGFANTAPGTGHLNADGNAAIARALYEEILRMEASA